MSCETRLKATTPGFESVDAVEFREAMRNVPGAVAVAAAGLPNSRNGLTVTAWCCLSIAPPTLLVCVNRASKSYGSIIANRAFSLNQLSVAQAELALVFAGETGLTGEERFINGPGEWDTFATGTPTLRASVGSYECRVIEAYDQPTHSVIVGRVVDARVSTFVKPLVYVRREFHQIGAIKRKARHTNWPHNDCEASTYD